MLTWIIVGGLFAAGVGTYGYLVYKERTEQEAVSAAFNHSVDKVLGQVHTLTDSLKARMTHAPSTDFEKQLREAMKDNP